jgi:hypothetical protein
MESVINVKTLGIVVAAFVAGSFVASPELRAYAANTVFSTDIVDGQVMTADLANNAVTAAKVKDGEIKAAEIATDAVGAAELQGVTKLLFGKCVLNNSENVPDIDPGSGFIKTCNIIGVDSNDFAVATFTQGSPCFAVAGAEAQTGSVRVVIRNVCSSSDSLFAGDSIAVIVYDK